MLTLLTLTALAAAPPGEHARQALELGAGAVRHGPPARGPLPPPTPNPAMKVYGYLAYWDDDLQSVPWDELTHIALFSAGANSDGSLYDTQNWDQAAAALAIAEPYGVRVHLCVTNFDPTSMGTLLASPTKRGALLDELVGWVAATGAHGVNIDFEGLPYSAKDDMVAFTQELDAAIEDVVLATPAVDWSGAWDYSELSKNADLFIMGYDYHWGGSAEAGPIDPLYSGPGTPWSYEHSISWSVEDYLYYDADPARTILGLALYGRWWDTAGASFPADALSDGSTVLYEDAWAEAATYGRLYDASSATPYYFDGSGQTWYGDTDSVRERIQYASGEGLGGIGFWALHYVDEPAFWGMVAEEAGIGDVDPGTDDTGAPGTDDPVDPGGEDPTFVADAGAPFLAYVGDTVVLSGAASTGPAPLAYAWTQVEGPAVDLEKPTTAEPRFVVAQPGNLVFELTVGDGSAWSAPARSHVVVIDPAATTKPAPAGGCDHTGGAGAGALLAALALTTRRRR